MKIHKYLINKTKSPVFQGLCKVKVAENTEFLRLAITVVCEVFEQATDTEFADVLLGSFGRNLQLFGNRKISLAVELWRKIVEKSL